MNYRNTVTIDEAKVIFWTCDDVAYVECKDGMGKLSDFLDYPLVKRALTKMAKKYRSRYLVRKSILDVKSKSVNPIIDLWAKMSSVKVILKNAAKSVEREVIKNRPSDFKHLMRICASVYNASEHNLGIRALRREDGRSSLYCRSPFYVVTPESVWIDHLMSL